MATEPPDLTLILEVGAYSGRLIPHPGVPARLPIG